MGSATGRRLLAIAAAVTIAAVTLTARSAAQDAADPAKVADLVAKLRDPDAEVRGAAADALVAVGGPAVPALLAVVQDVASPARRDAAVILGQIGGDALPALPAVANLVTDVKAKAQADAAMAVGRIAVGAAKALEPKVLAPSKADLAAAAGLEWLARHQSPDGHWSCAKYTDVCKQKPACTHTGESNYDVGVTGLALECFLSAGSTHVKGPHAARVEAGLRWLRGIQDAEGCFGKRMSQHFLYNHACAALALVEDYRRTGSRVLADPATRAVAFIQYARNPSAGWRYNCPPDGESDTSVTVWMAKVLDVAQGAGIDVDPAAMNGALAWVDSVTHEEAGRTGYQQKGGPPARTSEMLQKFPPTESESLTAAALVTRISVGRTRASDPYIALGEALLAQKPPVWSVPRGSIDLYYWMHGAEALHRLGGSAWDGWKKAIPEALAVGQRGPASGCAAGSWDGVDPWSPEAGRIWTTAASVLALLHAAEDPARRPALPAGIRSATWALDKALKSSDPAVRRAAQRSLDAIRAAFR
jgi:hypothetical protein